MIDGERLRARLGELARAHRFGAEAPAPAPDRKPGHPRAERVLPGFSAPAIGVEEFLPGGEWRDSPDYPGTPGAVYVHERLRSEIERPKPHWGRIETPPAHETELVELSRLGLEQALFLDLETCGLASTTLFLAGTMHWNGGDFVLRQYFARHYGEEGPLLRALAESMSGFEFLVTFNGKTFDVPFLLARAVVHGVRIGLPPRHLDLLHAARRRWRGELADCRLRTIEARVCRRWRVGDVPGDEIPGLYHDFVKRGDPYRLVPVFHHNLLDVVTMAEILRALCRHQPSRDPETAAPAES
ncbi:MAG TPA: ribonuclease H-like domain-containing protein [Terriglobales bacterium]|nr:ribonuclease H-like domain-containing protein [Terriglobales bacterium]